MKRRFVWAAATLALAAAIAATRTLWLPWPGEWLDVSGRIGPSDVIFAPSGNSLWRAKAAARLYKQNYAPRVVVTGGDLPSDLLLFVTGERLMETEIIGRMIEHLGVPRASMTLIDGVTSTYDDAMAFKNYTRSHGVRSAIVVTSHLHSRRARWMLRQVLGDPSIRLHFVEADQPQFAPATWWQREEGVITVFNEYLKFGYYLLHY